MSYSKPSTINFTDFKGLTPIEIQSIVDAMLYTQENTVTSDAHVRALKKIKAWRKACGKCLARLEAAEKYVKFDHRNWVEGGPKQQALYEAWRKAAGK